MKKLHKGFTLVELIVVIAIIGILAAILVPALVGYIRDAKLTGANSSAKSVYNAAMFVAQKCSVADVPIAASGAGTTYKFALSGCGSTEMPGPGDYTPGVGTGAAGSAEDILNKAIAASMNQDANGTWVSIVIADNGLPTAAAWAKTGSDEYVGAYPDAATDRTPGGISSYTFS